MLVLKFGGSSVGSPEKILDVAAIVGKSFGGNGHGVVVVSAMKGVTDELLAICDSAVKRDSDWIPALEKLVLKHLDVVRQVLPVASQSAALAHVKSTFNELEDLLRGIELLKEASLRTRDLVLSFGERASAYILSEVLSDKGMKSKFIDARDVLVANSEFGNARVINDLSFERARRTLCTPGFVYVVTGFIGATQNGETVTFGRGGSDYSASVLAELLDASGIEIWTDVDGFLTADPRKVPQAIPLAELSFEEAMELCHFGAKVIYPPTLQPASRKQIPLAIRNTFNPDFVGTNIIYTSVRHPRAITGVTSVPKVSLLRLEGNGMIGVSGISMRLFSAMAKIKANVIMITQASSEQSISVAVSPKDALKARNAVVKEFDSEIKDGSIKPVMIEDDLSIISVVGENMRRVPGIAGKIFSALGRQGVNIIAIAQGSSELSISVVVSSRDETKALISIHDSFFLADTLSANLALVGPGLIGKTLLRQVANHAAELKRSLLLEIKLVALADSKRMLIDKEGLACDKAYEKLSAEGRAYTLPRFSEEISKLNLPNTVVVDCSASSDVAAIYQQLITQNIAVVTPNKKAQSSNLAFYKTVKELSTKKRVPWLYETSVGAGLPVISTLNDLIRSGDRIRCIEGVLSGTLSYIFSNYDSGKKFSELVAAAKKAGFTEPDPRDDLNGMDVARKILILARESGVEAELGDVVVENLVPEALRVAMSAEEFLSGLSEFDEVFSRRVKKAEQSDKKLRYVASCDMTTEPPRLNVALTEVGPDSPFWSLNGTDNMVSFKSDRYEQRPLVVRGPGAGAEVTAAGVFADLIRAVT